MAEPQKKVEGVLHYKHDAGGWDALIAVGAALHSQSGLVAGAKALSHMNQPKGFDCPGCAWGDPAHTSPFEYCENGAKALSWEATTKRTDLSVFEKYSVSELLQRSDYELEDLGRLTHPLVYDANTDHYVAIEWEDAFSRIGAILQQIQNPRQVEFYTSGKASNEAAFLFQLFARAYGSNNFPDCSNMCHEPTSRGLPPAIGVGKATVVMEDFDKTDLILSFGHNPGTNHPRMMTSLHNASKRGAKIIAFNPFRERSLQRFTAPQNPLEMITGHGQSITSEFLQVAAGGDLAIIKGMMKYVFAQDDASGGQVIDHAFIKEHTVGLEALRQDVDAVSWDDIEAKSQVSRAQIESAAEAYIKAKNVIATYGMGLTQHRTGTANIQQLVNLLLLRGNIGREGAGICPLRGHSNVQGNRTVGITERPKPAMLDGIERAFGFRPTADIGHDTVGAANAFISGESKALICLGGNLAVALPDPDAVFPAMRKLDLSVYLGTKLNRSHLLTCRNTFILPVRSRSEKDEQAGVMQSITVEDTMSMVHASCGRREPASPFLRSEPDIIAAMAKATLGDRYNIDWSGMVENYDRIRDKIEIVYPDFKPFNARILDGNRFRLPVKASNRIWDTPTQKANFMVLPGLNEDPRQKESGALCLVTTRSHDQFNTTIYSLNDRYRGISGRRDILFMSESDLAEQGLAHGDVVDVEAIPDPSTQGQNSRIKRNLTVIAYDLPKGTIGAYYPETNVLIDLNHYDKQSGTPSYKSVPVKVRKAS